MPVFHPPSVMNHDHPLAAARTLPHQHHPGATDLAPVIGNGQTSLQANDAFPQLNIARKNSIGWAPSVTAGWSDNRRPPAPASGNQWQTAAHSRRAVRRAVAILEQMAAARPSGRTPHRPTMAARRSSPIEPERIGHPPSRINRRALGKARCVVGAENPPAR